MKTVLVVEDIELNRDLLGQILEDEYEVAFAADGAMVHIADVDAEAVEAVTVEQERISGSVTDVSDPRAVAALFEDVRTNLGGLDVLVNNAGVAGPTAPVGEYDADAFAAVVALAGAFALFMGGGLLIMHFQSRDARRDD